MAVFRIEKTRDYTVMSNHHLRDMSLSLKAKGLLSLMLSLPENWDYTMKGLSRICKDGIDSISGGIRELEEHGYLIRERVRGANGQLGSIEYTILEQPKEPTPAQEKPIRENPVQANPTLVTPVQEEPAQLNKDKSSNDPSRTDLSSTEVSNPIQSNPPTPAGARMGTDGMGARESYRELILENIEYDFWKNSDRVDHEMLDEITELIVDTVCSARKTIRIAGDDYPAEVVKSRFLKLDSSHVQYKSKKKIKNPESEWVIFENTHEPIWTEAIAEAVKQARQSRRRPTKMGEMGMFSGMMYCADCGSILYQCRATGFRKDQEYYICSGYRKGKQVCNTPHSIRTVILEELILQNLREIVSFARSHENRFAQMVMDMDVKERNKGLAQKRRLLSESKKRITELDMIFKRLYEDNISGKLTDERFHKLSTDYEAEQAGLQAQAAMLREEIEEAESKSANVDRFLSVVRQYTDIPELTPRILHEFVEKIVIHAATDPHSKINRRQEVDIYYKGIGILEMSKVFDSRQK